MKACEDDQHVIAINVGDIQTPDLSKLKPFTDLAYDYNYLVSFVNEPEVRDMLNLVLQVYILIEFH